MSSLSLPRVLQQRKTSLEQERENFEKFQTSSISKAINQTEHPVKEKHVRITILGTFHEKSGETFWACVHRLPLQENCITAWKFCHVLHKVLREGHPQAIASSQRHVSMIDDLGKLWGHLKGGYGRLIPVYCKLLVYKLRFHRRNPGIPGNLALSTEELDAVGENDINNFFQLSVEMFDYMDDVLALQEAIFGSLDMSRSNSMTSSGQCRLAPLIPAIQDSLQLYDICVKILFRLHAALPPDVLSGHRERFLKQFKGLRTFYNNSSALQYFKNLLQIPSLPENPPNFLIQAELRTYVTPVVVLPPEEPPDPPDTPSTGDLVDLATPPPTNGTTSPDIIHERDNLIEHLQNELSRYRSEISKLMNEHHSAINHYKNKITSLETELAKAESELVQERLVKEDLLQQTEIVAKYHETEKKCKTVEEKFQKLKEVYTKLREEHIQLIRQKADVDKQLANIKSLELDSNEKMRLEHLSQELVTLQASADSAYEQNQALESKLDFLTKEKMQIESELHDLLSTKEELEQRIQASVIEKNKVQDSQNQLFERILLEAESIVKRAVHEVDNPALSSATCSLDYFRSLVDSLETSMEGLELSPAAPQVVKLAYLTSDFVIHGKTTSNTAPDIELGDRIAQMCKKVAECCLEGFHQVKEKRSVSLENMRTSLADLLALTSSLEKSLQKNTESIGDLVEGELAAMDKAIEEAAKKIEEMLNQSRAADSGIKLEVNEKILDSCTGLMQAIRILVQKSRILQGEIVVRGKGSASVKEFYKRNSQWTEGLISAAKAVGMGARYLLDAADDVVSGKGKVEFVMVAAQEISASTAQLVVASRVKAERSSSSLSALTDASRGVTQATATVVTTAKACVQLVEHSEDLDLSGLSLHNAKRLEMEAQVRVLELENLVDKERLHLSALRKLHYSLAPDSDQLPPA